MKRFVSAALGLVALVAVTPASAADLPRSMPYKAPVMMSVFNWTGSTLVCTLLTGSTASTCKVNSRQPLGYN